MNLIQAAISRPIAVISAVLMVVMFGLLALKVIPVQLAPDVRRPILTVTTIWPSAAPEDVEREIINRQEDVLKGLEGLEQMLSEAQNSSGTITLEFSVGTNMDRALLLVANRLDRVSGYPDEADEPILKTAGAEDNPIAWIVVKRKDGNTRDIHTYGDFAEDIIRPAVERTPGVGLVNIYGGSERQLELIVQPQKLASFGVSITQLVTTLRQNNIALSAGDIDEGKRRYVVRTDAELNSVESLNNVVLSSNTNPDTGQINRVMLRDIAKVQFGYTDAAAHIRHLGEPAIAFNAVRETGANVIETMAALRENLKALNDGPLAQENLYLTQVYDETVYIDSAIDLVKSNIYLGGLLAAIILMLFLRSWGATFIISVAIPVSVIGSFVAMAAMGRSINVISLAGLAFAVGMVVDAAIVVLENIYRLRQQGVSTVQAAYRGASEVWGAILVSALTTVMVFIPLLVMELEVGQLFRDIAVAISVAVCLSLVVAITLIPAMGQRFLKRDPKDKPREIPVLDNFAKRFTNKVVSVTDKVISTTGRSLGVIAVVTGLGIFISAALLPKLEYLPQGNRNLIFGFIMPPPGYNLDATTGIGTRLEQAIKPLWASETGPEDDENGRPKIDNFFFVSFGQQAIVGASAVDGSRASELLPALQMPIFSEPGTFGFMMQPSIFGRGIGGTRSINLDISGADLNQVITVAQKAAGLVGQVFPRQQGHQMRPIPGLELGEPELQVIPNRVALADAGVSATELALTIDTYNDGLRVDEITVAGKRLDLMLKGEPSSNASTQQVNYYPVVTKGGIAPVDSLAEINYTNSAAKIRHLEQVRTVTLEISPHESIPLEAATETINQQVMAKLLADGLPEGIHISLSGTADQLTQTWDAMVLQLLVALVIVYLVMAVLFESFAYPIIILFSVPLALAGAILGLALVNLVVPGGQKLDMLTLLGFVILIGIVVNNAILLVHQTLHHIREDAMTAKNAILEATRNRIRPIFMSSLTSVVGMLPLVLIPGAGSELYRGLGAVVVGGLSMSAVLTLLIVPPLLALFLRATGNDGDKKLS